MSSTKTVSTPGCCNTAPAPSACTTSWVQWVRKQLIIVTVCHGKEGPHKLWRKLLLKFSLCLKVSYYNPTVVYILTAAMVSQGRSGSPRGPDSSRVQSKARVSSTLNLTAALTTTLSPSMPFPFLWGPTILVDPLDPIRRWATTQALLQGKPKLCVFSTADRSAPAAGTTYLQRVPEGPTGSEVTAGLPPTTTPHAGPATTIGHPVLPNAVHPAQDCTMVPPSYHSPVEYRPIAGRTRAVVQVAATIQFAVDIWPTGRRVTPARGHAMAPPVTQFSIALMFPCRGSMAAGPPSVALWVVTMIHLGIMGQVLGMPPAGTVWRHVPRPGPGLWILWWTKQAAPKNSHKLCSAISTTTATDTTTTRRGSTARARAEGQTRSRRLLQP